MKKNKWYLVLAFVVACSVCFSFWACSKKNSETEYSISLNHEEATMEVGEAIQLEVTSDSDDEIEWKTSNFSFAAVNNGLVTAKKAGIVTITAIQGTAKATCTILIHEASISLNYSSLNLKVGGYVRLTVNSKSNEDIKWQSSNLTIATVSSIGWVTARKAGTVTITAKQGNAKATCSITVQ